MLTPDPASFSNIAACRSRHRTLSYFRSTMPSCTVVFKGLNLWRECQHQLNVFLNKSCHHCGVFSEPEEPSVRHTCSSQGLIIIAKVGENDCKGHCQWMATMEQCFQDPCAYEFMEVVITYKRSPQTKDQKLEVLGNDRSLGLTFK